MTTKKKMQTRITEEKYLKIKSELNSPKDDCRVMKKYGIGKSTTRRIRNTQNYYEYRATSTTGRRERKRLETALADLREEDFKYIDYDDGPADRVAAFIVVIVALLLLAVSGIVAMINLGGK